MSDGRVSCSWVRDRLEPFLDDELSSPEVERLRNHLMECLACRVPLSPMVRSRRALREEVPVDDIPLGAAPGTRPDRRFFLTMHRAIMARVRGLPVRGLRGPRWKVAAGVAAAALFLLGLATARLLDRTDAGPAPEPPSRASANLLQRNPIEAARPYEEEPSMLVTVGHRSSWGLGGRVRALRCLDFEPAGRGARPAPGKRP